MAELYVSAISRPATPLNPTNGKAPRINGFANICNYRHSVTFLSAQSALDTLARSTSETPMALKHPNHLRRNHAARGFTLIEVMIVVALTSDFARAAKKGPAC